jgi:hypothetical protein
MLEQAFREFERQTHLVTSNPLLCNVKHEYFKLIDSDMDEYVVQMKKRLMGHLQKMKPIYDSHHGSFYNDYSEVTLYIIIKRKGYSVQAINTSSKCTPDFGVTIGNTKVTIETKSPLPMNPEKNICKFQQECHESNVELDRRKKPGKVNFGKEIVYSPHVPNKTDSYDPHSNLMVINNIIGKIDQNCKDSQLSDNSVLVFDLTQLTMHTAPTCSPFVFFGSDSVVVSAPLWNVCFGTAGSSIFGHAFHPRGNLEGCMSRNGVMIDNLLIQAIVFRFDHHQKDTRFYGFVKGSSTLHTFIEGFCDEYNTEQNSLYCTSVQ